MSTETLRGTPASGGRSAGPVFVAAAGGRDRGPAHELGEAVELVAGRLERLAEAGRARGPAAAGILEAQAEMARDPTLRRAIEERLAAGAPPARAALEAAEAQAAVLEGLGDPYIRERAADVREVGRLLAAELGGTAVHRLTGLTRPSIVVAHELSPADTLSVDPGLLLGIVTETGGPTSHAAIVARELGIPAVVGVGGAVLAAGRAGGAEIDGDLGELRLGPSVPEAAARAAGPRLDLATAPVALMANVGSEAGARSAARSGARGIGLFRTEFMFLAASGPMPAAAQAEAYEAACEAMFPHPVVIRTLDAGSDKPLPYLPAAAEPNPALGRRGVRLWLAREELWRPQVDALVETAARWPNLRVMLPMVAAREEMELARQLFAEAARRRGAAPPPLGMMVEVPGVAAALEAFGGVADFVSLGTNDLTQYTVGADRELRWDVCLSELNPGVLRLVAAATRSAGRLGIDAGVCGEMAGTPEGAVFLAGAGATSLSMTADALPRVFHALTRVGLPRCREAADAALAATTAADASAVLRDALAQAGADQLR